MRSRRGFLPWRRRTILLSILTVVGAFAIAPPAPATAAACAGSIDNDFNGDGVRDVASADPLATVGTAAKAGTVTVITGSTGGVTVLSQDSANIPGGAGAGDQWGSSLASYDANADGCSDLVVGAPFEDIGTAADAGAVWILYGSTSGLTTAASFDQSQDAVPGSAEAGDWFGYSLSASKTSGGVPFLLAGAPGEDVGTTVDAGTAGLYRAGT